MERDGYYFAGRHSASWWEVLQHLAVAAHARGLVHTTELKLWPSDERAAEDLGFPTGLVRIMGTIK